MSLKARRLSDLKALKIPYQTGGENISAKCIGIHCPDCNDHAFHMGLFIDKGNASCWRCGASYSYKKILVALAQGNGIPQAVVQSILSAHIDVPAVQEERRPVFAESSVAASTAIAFPHSFEYVTADSPDWVLDFIESRNVSLETCEAYDIGYCTQGKQKDRLIVPIFYKDELVSYQGRDTTGEHPIKYLTAQGSINRFLFGIDDVDDLLIITEGVFDAIRLGPPAVCTFGTHITADQMALIIQKNVRRIVFAWDSDAYIKARKALKKIQPFVEAIKIVKMPQGEDPDSLGKKRTLELISSAAWI